MMNYFTIVCWILLFFSPGYVPVFANGKVFTVRRGLDASLRCRSETSYQPNWKWYSKEISNIKTLVVNSTAYLFVENFQKINEGWYICNNGIHNVSKWKLEIEQGIQDKNTPVYRSTKTGLLNLSCLPLVAEKIQGFWRWGQTGLKDCKFSATDLAHFGNRSKIMKEHDNQFELSISPLLWNDSGQYRCILCSGSKYYKSCTYEVITVKVYTDPEELMEGEDGFLVCAVSHAKESTRLLWIDKLSDQMFSNPEEHKPVSEFRLSVRNVTLKQNAWVCAVFHLDDLRGLLPLHLAIKRRATPTTQSPELSSGGATPKPVEDQAETSTHIPTGLSKFYVSLACLTGLLLLCLGISFIIYTKKICRWRHQGDSQTPNDDAVNYATLRFKKKKAADTCGAAVCASDNLLAEEDSVIYSAVNLVTGI